MSGMALALAICGALGLVARRWMPRSAGGAIQVVGRVSLSPKHTVYMLRVGQRVLLLGAGPQGAPALLTELDDLAELSPRSEEGGEP
jgi:flagellar biogenesis protein FliO